MSFKLICDSLSEQLSKSSDSFFWCVVCKTLESSLDRDITTLQMNSSSYTQQFNNISSEAQTQTSTPIDELRYNIDDFKTKSNSKVPSFSNIVQTTGANQSSYNSYHENMRNLIGGGIDPTTLSRMGMNVAISTLDQSFPSSFLTSQYGSARECFSDLLGSYNCSEFLTFMDIFSLLGFMGNIGSFIKSLLNGITTYANIGCNPQKGLEMEARVNSSINQLPLDENYDFNMDELYDNLETTPEYTNNIKEVQSEIGPVIEDTLNRLSI